MRPAVAPAPLDRGRQFADAVAAGRAGIPIEFRPACGCDVGIYTRRTILRFLKGEGCCSGTWHVMTEIHFGNWTIEQSGLAGSRVFHSTPVSVAAFRRRPPASIPGPALLVGREVELGA